MLEEIFFQKDIFFQELGAFFVTAKTTDLGVIFFSFFFSQKISVILFFMCDNLILIYQKHPVKIHLEKM